jgi:streptogramin lyase
VSDFISGLRSDLVEAAAREQRRGALGRATRPLHPRAWSRGAALGAAAVAAAAAAFVLAVVALAPKPADRPARAKVVATYRVGGVPTGAAAGGGSLWIADFNGSLLRLDPANGRILRRFPLGAQPDSLAVAGDDVWVRVDFANGHDPGAVLRLDPRTGRVLARVSVGSGSGIAVGARSVWVPRRFNSAEDIDRIDRRRAVIVDRIGVRNVDGAVEAAGVLWVAVHAGTIVQIDARSGRVVRRWHALAPSDAGASGAGTLVADPRGLWVLSTSRAELFRLEAGKVIRRIAVDPTAQPLLARTRGGFWISAGGGPSAATAAPNRLERIDPDTGRVTARVDIGVQRPVALVPVGRDLVVVTSQGRVLVVRG